MQGKNFSQQVASNANLTVAGRYFFEYLLTKKILLVFGFGFGVLGVFCSYLAFMVI